MSKVPREERSGEQADREAAYATRLMKRGEADKLRSCVLPKNWRSESGETLLMRAMRLRRIEVAQRYVESGRELDRRDDAGRTALMVAARGGWAKGVRLLATPERAREVDGAGLTALLAAVGDHDGAGAVGDLIPFSDLGAKDKKGQDALCVGARYGRADAVRSLLAAGAVPIATDEGYDPLMLAAREGSLECVRMLIGPCDPKRASPKGDTALSLAACFGYGECAKALAPFSDMRRFHGKSLEELARTGLGRDKDRDGLADWLGDFQLSRDEAAAMAQAAPEPAARAARKPGL